jgi:hypothetical protein
LSTRSFVEELTVEPVLRGLGTFGRVVGDLSTKGVSSLNDNTVVDAGNIPFGNGEATILSVSDRELREVRADSGICSCGICVGNVLGDFSSSPLSSSGVVGGTVSSVLSHLVSREDSRVGVVSRCGGVAKVFVVVITLRFHKGVTERSGNPNSRSRGVKCGNNSGAVETSELNFSHSCHSDEIC